MIAAAGAPSMAERILDAAEELVQVRGFNAFSYADVAARLEVTKASLHYHFAGKAQLGEALITRYTARFADALDSIDAGGAPAPAKLAAYAALYADVLSANRMCLCGMLAAEYQTLAEPMRDAVVRFFDLNEVWLAATLTEGQAAGTVRLSGSARDAARVILSGLEGAMLMTRPYGDIERFRAAADGILAGVTHPADA
jgi:TetR/AcrR family transcriptional regulator, transcriptional repressor for nem operon